MPETNPNVIHTHHSTDRRWCLHHGDIDKVLPTISTASFDGVFCDPPYGLKFMSHDWDSAVPPIAIWRQILRVCKPGSYLLAFGGTKTFHRLTCNIEDAGWIIKDVVMWLHGEGFPKGIDISKAIDKKAGALRRVIGKNPNSRNCSLPPGSFFQNSRVDVPITAPASDEAKRWHGYCSTLKPAWEPIILAQKPPNGTFAENALNHGCGGLNIDECRIGAAELEAHKNGRWPANLLLDEESARQLDRQSGTSKSCRGVRRHKDRDIGNGKTLHPFRSNVDTVAGFDDQGGASRFFYVAKSSPKEKFENDHPTVKPLKLCEYLARLILQPERATPRRLLVPFSGSGSEMLGGLRAGWDHVSGIEWEDGYVEIARRRLRYPWAYSTSRHCS
jgi:DNA modification methylase